MVYYTQSGQEIEDAEMDNMRREGTEETVTLSQFANVYGITHTYRFVEHYNEYIGLDEKKRTYTHKAERTRYSVTLHYQGRTYTTPFSQSRDEREIKIQWVLDCLRSDIDSLFGYTEEFHELADAFPLWKKVYIDNFGEECRKYATMKMWRSL